ncbi:DNA-directed RNA polymerase, mitochondrial [Pocillopora verrucosa]|uniref:DNA-directed RNA polymerase, mitochondrial n=1 Tax=Pocillopora verrucosa TaxID=203993 RepID=UPI0033419FFE
MAFLQICRRHRPVFGAGYSLERLLTGRSSFSSCFLLHHNVQFAPTCLAKRNLKKSLLGPRSSNQLLTCLFTTQAHPLQQQNAIQVTNYESSTDNEPTHTKKKIKATGNNTKKKNVKKSEAVKIVNDTVKSNGDENIIKEISNEVKNQLSSASKLTLPVMKKIKGMESSKAKSRRQSTDIVWPNVSKDDFDTKKKVDQVSVTNRKGQLSGTNNTKAKKKSDPSKKIMETTTSRVSGVINDNETHSLDYSPEVVLIEAEEHFHEQSKFEDIDGSVDQHVCNVEVQGDVAKPLYGNAPGEYFEGPAKYKDGTPGGRLFKEETLAEMDAYLYLGKPKEAEKLFNRYLRMGKRFEVDTFNKLLHGWAQKGNIMSIKFLWNLLNTEGLEPDMGTYAALLHGYGKYGNKEGVQTILDEMKQKEFDVNNIFIKCCLTEPQAKGVSNAIKLVDPHFQPVVKEAHNQIRYPSLLKLWYSDRDNLDIKLKSVPGKLERELDESRLQELFEEQISRELSGFTPIMSIEDNKEQNTENQRLKEMFLDCRSKWKEALIKTFDNEMYKTRYSRGNRIPPKHASFFQVFEPDELADIILDTIVFYVKGRIEGVPLYGISGELGSVLNTKYIVKHRVQSGMLDKMKAIYLDYFSYLMDEKVMATKMAREFWDEMDDMLPLGGSLEQDVPNWPWAAKVVFGCSLVECFLKTAQINVNLFNNGPEKMLPAFYHTYEFKMDKRYGVLKPHPIVCKLFKGYLAKQGEISMETTSVPMLVPPRPWRATKDGAYLILPVELIRSTGDEDGQYDKLLEEKTNKEDLVAIFDSLNFLGGCAWRTNKRILDLAIHMFNNGGNEDLAVPGPVIQPEVDSISSKTDDLQEKNKLVRERRLAKKVAREQYSLRMSALYKLSVANHFRDHVFWLPINLDFRGRVYPIPPHCAHVGDDLSRGMLQFAKGVPLGEKGLDWLKIHLVTLHGAKKKSSLQERLDYANEIMDDIVDSAENPLMGRGWWKTADDPWQTLATCMEIVDAMRSPDPAQYISHQPVHQDGSCNGLQHYAALGHDSYGAKQVNLMPADRPQDVYEEVAKLVEATRARDAADGNEIAKDLEGKVTRKVVKQTVMTIVYGVTFVGGRLQIERQLRDLDMDPKLVFKCSHYLVNKVFASIGEMFTAASAIQNWFASSATQIALVGHYVDWYTPLGLYVRQPYCKKPVRHSIKTNLQWLLLKVKGLPDIPPDSRKQRGAFPPNFVHSLDSTHMMLTALYCQRSGSTFASVHDSFWTHAANVGVMNRICREQFVTLHREPILEELQNHFEKNYANLKLNRPLKSKNSKVERTRVSFDGRPELGDFDINEVLHSTYFFC